MEWDRAGITCGEGLWNEIRILPRSRHGWGRLASTVCGSEDLAS